VDRRIFVRAKYARECGRLRLDGREKLRNYWRGPKLLRAGFSGRACGRSRGKKFDENLFGFFDSNERSGYGNVTNRGRLAMAVVRHLHGRRKISGLRGVRGIVKRLRSDCERNHSQDKSERGHGKDTRVFWRLRTCRIGGAIHGAGAFCSILMRNFYPAFERVDRPYKPQ
jgi:hypothetical protein